MALFTSPSFSKAIPRLTSGLTIYSFSVLIFFSIDLLPHDSWSTSIDSYIKYTVKLSFDFISLAVN